MRRSPALLALSLCWACADTGTAADSSDTGTTSAEPTDGGADSTGDGADGAAVEVVANSDVDILFVIDNSGSMGDEQGLLAQSFAPFVAVLEASAANYRIGIDVAKTDVSMATPSTLDDLSARCVDQGWNLEFAVVRRDDVPAPPGAAVRATCVWSEQPQIDCPELPG